MKKLFYIRTQGYKGNALIWWAPNSRGYTCDINNAGKYPEKEAMKICSGSKTELAYNCKKIDKMEQGKMLVIHADYLQKSDADMDFR